jgi:hypothetical protein
MTKSLVILLANKIPKAMRHRLLSLSILVTVLLSFYVQAASLHIRIPPPRYKDDALYFYFKELLIKSLIYGADGKALPVLEIAPPMAQQRTIQELSNGNLIDINWMGLDESRMMNLKIIAIPLERGLFGYRRFIINKKSLARFDAIANIDDLKEFTACQGLGWPDTKILRSAGLKVREMPGHEAIFQQIVANRCDYFPRGYLEPESELASLHSTYPDITIYDGMMLHYPYGIFFFVNKKNAALESWIRIGLERMIDNGALLQYMKQYPLTARSFPLKKSARIFEIPNKIDGIIPGISNERFWFQAKDFQ